MLFFYLFALIPILIGGVLWICDSKIVWYEWLIGSVIALILAAGFNAIVLFSETYDTETWSGEITSTVFYPQWVEEYEVAVYKTVTHTDSRGNTYTTEEFSHYETHYRTHHEHWTVKCTVNGEIDVPFGTHVEVRQNFGNNKITTTPYKSGFYSGDKNVYIWNNETKFIYPTTNRFYFENRIKIASSVFSFVKVPDDINIFEYPHKPHFMQSNRLLGTAQSSINITEFDRLNSYLGPLKKVNIILVGFPAGTPSTYGEYQKAEWLGGKKNDLVIVFAGNNKAEWVNVFGWTEREDVKRNLETLFLNHNIDNTILPLIRSEVIKNYVIKDWSKFDYIKIEAPWSYKITYVILLIVSQCIIYIICHLNEKSKTLLIKYKPTLSFKRRN